MLLHEYADFADLLDVVGREQGIDPSLVEKDYWIMHALWGLQRLGFAFALKGGTSLSKGYHLIDRFSEDIDILIYPDPDPLPVGRNQTKPAQVEARRAFFDGLPARIEIAGFEAIERDRAFDDPHMRSAGIRLRYGSRNPLPGGVKDGILLEAGFDQVAPNHPCQISSWAYDKAASIGLDGLIDNRAMDVLCYEPGYTLVEKLQTISTKYRRCVAGGGMPQNFMRHYYDVYCLLGDPAVQEFVGSPAYTAHKTNRFRGGDNMVIAENPAFELADSDIRGRFASAYSATSSLYYRGQPTFETILSRIREFADRL